MKLGRTCAVAAVLAATTLPLTAAVGLADEPAPVPREEVARQVAERTTEAREQAARAEDQRRLPDDQVSRRPVGAPDTGGGPQQAAIDAPAIGGAAAAAAAVAGGGALLVLRRRRTGTN